MKKTFHVVNYISEIYPTLIEKISSTIRKSEKEYNGKKCDNADSFLWEHTLQVSAFAYKISLMEKVDPLIPVITALFHDSGKFVKGEYHADDKPEEEYAVDIANKILKQIKADKEQIAMVKDALSSLYQDRSKCKTACSIVHDSDFLDKFGYIGVTNFFMKAALRGKPLQETILTSLSKELTYSSTAVFNMMTKSGKKLALKRSSDSLKFYDRLLSELSEFGIGSYRLEKIKLDQKTKPAGSTINDNIEIILVKPDSCRMCGGDFKLSFTRSKGVKCEELRAEFRCKKCGKTHEISFCIPEICKG